MVVVIAFKVEFVKVSNCEWMVRLSDCYIVNANCSDQVYCGWLIKWDVKRETIQLAELCLTIWKIISGNTGWYLVCISWHCLVLGGTRSSKGLFACMWLLLLFIDPSQVSWQSLHSVVPQPLCLACHRNADNQYIKWYQWAKRWKRQAFHLRTVQLLLPKIFCSQETQPDPFRRKAFQLHTLRILLCSC